MEAFPPSPPPFRPPPAPGSVATATPPAPESAVATSPMPPPVPKTSATAPPPLPGPSAPSTLRMPFDWTAFATAAARAAFLAAFCSGESAGFFSVARFFSAACSSATCVRLLLVGPGRLSGASRG